MHFCVHSFDNHKLCVADIKISQIKKNHHQQNITYANISVGYIRLGYTIQHFDFRWASSKREKESNWRICAVLVSRCM